MRMRTHVKNGTKDYSTNSFRMKIPTGTSNDASTYLVLMFFLNPLNLGVRVLVDLVLDEVEWERTDLLHAYEGDVRLLIAIGTSFLELVVDLAGAEQELLDVRLIVLGCSAIRNNSLEVGAFHHVVETALGLRMPEKALGGEYDQRFAERKDDLASHRMEIVGRCSAIHNDHVTVVQLLHREVRTGGIIREMVWLLGAELEEPLRSRRGMFWAHSLHSMGKHHDQA